VQRRLVNDSGIFRNYELILRFIDNLFIYGVIKNAVGRSGNKRVHMWSDY